jgi:hypothetical protein
MSVYEINRKQIVGTSCDHGGMCTDGSNVFLIAQHNNDSILYRNNEPIYTFSEQQYGKSGRSGSCVAVGDTLVCFISARKAGDDQNSGWIVQLSGCGIANPSGSTPTPTPLPTTPALTGPSAGDFQHLTSQVTALQQQVDSLSKQVSSLSKQVSAQPGTAGGLSRAQIEEIAWAKANDAIYASVTGTDGFLGSWTWQKALDAAYAFAKDHGLIKE